MAGNWVGPAFDPLAASSAHWFVGDVLEFTHLDDEGQDQGNSVGLVQSFTPGAGYMVNLLWIQDMSLKDWLLSDHGHGNPGRYDLARSNSLDLTVTRGEPPVQPIGTWRRLGTYADYSLADVHWARKQKVRAVAAVNNGIDYWRRHLPHDHPAALLAPASAPPTPLHTPTALPAFPPLPPVGLAQAPSLPIPEFCGSLATEIAQLRHEIDERPVLEGRDGLLRRKAPEPAQPEREGSRHARAREVHRASSTPPRRRVRDARGCSSGEDAGTQKAQESKVMQPRGSPRHRSLFSCSSSRPRHSGHHSGPQRHDYHGAARALSPPSARRARQGRSLTPPPREGLIPGAQRLPPKGHGRHRQVQVSRVVRSRSRRGERAEKAQDLDEAPITMDYQSEFARIKEERRRLKELERTLRAELKDVAKRAPDEKLLFGKPLRALEGGKAAGRRDRSRSLGRSSSRSFFRGARLGDGDPGLSKLAEWADQNEGVLTARLLQRMADALGRDGKRRSWDITSTPAVANSYVLQVIQTSFPSLGGRNQRELLTLAEALDRMASGDYGRAADVLSQRFKAIEMALHDGEWSRASHVEILPQTGRPLLSRQEEALVARDIREEVPIKAHLDKAGVVAGRGAAGVRTGSPHDRQPADKTKDKGRGKHGKGKDRARHRETDRKEDDKKHERKK